MFSWCLHFLPILGVNVFCFSAYSLISGLFQFNTGGVVVVCFFICLILFSYFLNLFSTAFQMSSYALSIVY